MDEDAAIILVFGQMTIEAFCNTYLLQHFLKTHFKDKPFIDKVNLTIVTIFEKSGIVVDEKDAHDYYGAYLPNIIAIRKKCVHRYPVRVEFDIDSDIEFEEDAITTVKQIENKYLKKIKRSDVENAATTYQKLIDKLKISGANFDTIGFPH